MVAEWRVVCCGVNIGGNNDLTMFFFNVRCIISVVWGKSNSSRAFFFAREEGKKFPNWPVLFAYEAELEDETLRQAGFRVISLSRG